MTRLDEIKERWETDFSSVEDMHKDQTYLIHRVEKLETALKFYLPETHDYDGTEFNTHRCDCDICDNGKIARAVLSDSDEETK